MNRGEGIFKKVIGIIFIFAGITIISIMSFLSLESTKTTYGINTSKIIGNEFDNSQYDFCSYDEGLSNDYVKTHNLKEKNKIIFPVLKKMNTYNVENNEFFKEFSLDNLTVVANVIPSYSIDKYTERLISDYKNGDFEKLNYSVSKNCVNADNLNFGHIKFQYMYNNDYNEDFYIVLDSSKDEITLIRYNIVNKKFNDTFLNNIANNIKVEKNSAKYLISSQQNNELVGVLKNDSINEISNGYQISYKIASDRYQEIENENNTNNYTTFVSKDFNLLINIEIRTTSESNIVELLETEYKNKSNHDKYNMDYVVIGNREYVKISLESGSSNHIKYQNIYIYKIDEKNAYVITMTSDDNEDTIIDFTNFEIK